MKCIRLTRTDASSDDITLPLGEVVIGRGNIFQCKDPRVSRKHGLLKLSGNDGVTLLPTHSNPCFYKKGADKSVCIIRKGSEVILENGDEFALLPDRFWFSITVVQDEAGGGVPIENNEADVEPSEADVTVSLTEEDIEDGVASSSNRKDDMAVNNEEGSNVLNVSKIHSECSTLKPTNEEIPAVTHSTPKKQRILPSWMTLSSKDLPSTATKKGKPKKILQQTNEDVKSDEENEEETDSVVTKARSKKTTNANSGVKRSPRKKAVNTSTDQDEEESNVNSRVKRSSPRKKALNTSTDQDEKDSNVNSHAKRSSPRKKALNTSTDQDEEELNATNVTKKDSAHVMSDDENDEKKDQAVSDVPSTSKRTKKDSPPVNVPVTTTPAASTSTTTRKLCIYGRDCFRKNPDHKREFCHPADPDYVQIYRSLPECEYGKQCYRKNREHRSTYRHDGRKNKGNTPTKNSPRKAKKNAAANTRRAAAASSEEDDYDYDDPFLYDGSSDDYQPTDSDASTDSDWISDGDSEPDLKRMKKEGKKFVKGK